MEVGGGRAGEGGQESWSVGSTGGTDTGVASRAVVGGAAVLGTDEPEGLGRENREQRRPVADQITFKQSKELKCLNLGKPA